MKRERHEVLHLGYEVPTGEPVSIPVFHTAITGQTQKSGKTTTLEALISRAGKVQAVAFVTKRGEGSFTAGRQIKPFFRERADSEFVRSILESMMREKMKFERAWISKACKGAHSLSDVRFNCHELESKSKRGLDQDMFMLLGEYLDKVVPLIRSLPKADELKLQPGLNVMDLSRYPLELQMLVISSTLQKVYEEGEGVITIIPECWEFVPQSRNTPVKLVVEKLARKGAGLKNYIWLDSQDMAGVDKLLLRACAVWLIGVQRESNEVKRALANMPGGMKKPKPDDVATLDLGQFFVSHGTTLKKVYVQPAWMEDDLAKKIAADGATPLFDKFHKNYSQQELRQDNSGEPADESAHAPVVAGGESGNPAALPDSRHIHNRSCWDDPGPGHGPPFLVCGMQEEEAMPKKVWTEEELMQAAKPSPAARDTTLSVIRALLPILNQGHVAQPPPAVSDVSIVPPPQLLGDHSISVGWLVQAVIAEIRKDPVLIRLSQERPAIEVKIERKTVKVDGSSYQGRIASLIADHWWNGTGRSFKEISKELVRRGMPAGTPNVRISGALKEFVGMGFFYRGDNEEYILVPGSQVRVVE